MSLLYLWIIWNYADDHFHYRDYQFYQKDWVLNNLGQIFFKRSISAISFSGLGPGIDKRFFASCSKLSLVSRKNKDFFENGRSADDQLIPFDMSNIVVEAHLYPNWAFMDIKLIHFTLWVHFWPFPTTSTLLSWFFVKIRFSKIIYGAGWNLKMGF